MHWAWVGDKQAEGPRTVALCPPLPKGGKEEGGKEGEEEGEEEGGRREEGGRGGGKEGGKKTILSTQVSE